MGQKHYKAEQIVCMLRQADVLLSQGKFITDICRDLGISDSSYYKWREDYGGLGMDQVKRLKQLETENTRLKRAIADLTLDKQILKDAASGNF